jgi:hypothetical protein
LDQPISAYNGGKAGLSGPNVIKPFTALIFESY